MIKIRTSRFSLPDWKDTAYPVGLREQDAFSYLSAHIPHVFFSNRDHWGYLDTFREALEDIPLICESRR